MIGAESFNSPPTIHNMDRPSAILLHTRLPSLTNHSPTTIQVNTCNNLLTLLRTVSPSTSCMARPAYLSFATEARTERIVSVPVATSIVTLFTVLLRLSGVTTNKSKLFYITLYSSLRTEDETFKLFSVWSAAPLVCFSLFMYIPGWLISSIEFYLTG